MSEQTPESAVVPSRCDISEELTWDLTPLYAAPEAWEADFARLDEALEPVRALQGRLDSAGTVAQLLEAETVLDRRLERLYTHFEARQRQIASLLRAHGLAVEFIHCQGDDARAELAAPPAP